MPGNVQPFNSEGGFYTSGNVVAVTTTTTELLGTRGGNLTVTTSWEFFTAINQNASANTTLLVNTTTNPQILNVTAINDWVVDGEFITGSATILGIANGTGPDVGNIAVTINQTPSSGGGNISFVPTQMQSWTFGADGNLTMPGNTIVKAGDGYTAIQFSTNGVVDNGSTKVDSGNNMVTNAVSNYYVKQAGSDRLAITNTDTNLMAATNVVIQSNKTATANTWTFDTTGNLTAPGNISASGNITAGHFYGNASGLTNVPPALLNTRYVAAGPSGIFISTADNFVAVDRNGQVVITVTLPSTANIGQVFTVKQTTGFATSFLIQSDDVANVLVDAQANVTTPSVAYGSFTVVCSTDGGSGKNYWITAQV